jgi:DNA helicase-2/ATP-dependent DNA helicase PcrA
MEKLSVAANENDRNTWDIISNMGEYNLGLSGAVQEKIADFVTMIKSFAAELETKGAYELADTIATSCGINKDLYDNKTPEGLSRYENLQELLNGIKEFTDTWQQKYGQEIDTTEDKPPGLSHFLEDIALLTDADTDDPNDRDRVSLMTIHAAKGLEFPVVYVVGLEENLFPSQLSINSREDLEEERRLFYVALTRARQKVHISYATTRYRWGNLVQCEPSRFLEEIDEIYLIQPEILESPPITRSMSKVGWKRGNKGWSFKKKKAADPPKIPPAGLRDNLVKFSKAANKQVPEFEADDIVALQVGMEVEHERFGTGKVLQIEGSKANQKAIVFFAEVGQKQLLLKYARLKILNN